MYSPTEDSYFLSEQLKKVLGKLKDKSIGILDMGSGSGIQAETCLNLRFNNIICVDIDKEVIKYLKKKFKSQKSIKIIQSNLFSNINKKQKFDLIIFNPPYLPENNYDKEKDTAGGKLGDETIIRFIQQAKPHLKEKGKILLLLSSLTPKPRIEETIKKLRLNKKKIADKNLFFERLEIWVIFLS